MILLTHNEIKKLLTYEFLYEEYVINQKSYAKIAKENGINSGTVSVYIKKFGIPSNGFGRKGCVPWNKGLTKETDERIAALSESRSINSKKMWQRPGFREKQLRILNSPEIVHNRSEKSKKRWQDPVWREKMMNSLTIANSRPEVKKARSETGKRLAKDPEFIRKNSESHILLWQDPEWRKKSIEAHNKPDVISRIGKASKERWEDPKWREIQIQKLHDVHNTPKAKERHSIVAKELWKSYDFWKKHSDFTKKQWKDPLIRDSRTGRNSPNFGRVPSINSSYGQSEWFECCDGRIIFLRSSYEARIANILDQIDVSWSYEESTYDLLNSTYHPDFLIKDNGIIWEVKGYLSASARSKIDKFIHIYPDLDFRIIWLPDIVFMESCIKAGISFDIELIGGKCLDFKPFKMLLKK